MATPTNPKNPTQARPKPLTEDRGLPTPKQTPPMPKVSPPKHKMNDEVDIAAEMISLSIKAGRRASYDLKHAVDYITDSEMKEFFYKRATMWLKIFELDSGLKDYRHTLHREIDVLELKIKRYRDLLLKNNIDVEDEIPF